MDLEDIDVAYALEDIRGVRQVYAVQAKALAAYRYVVELHDESHGYTLAQAHYALRRARSRLETEDVAFFHTDLPPGLRRHLSPLVLDAQLRALARSRAPTFDPLPFGPSEPTPEVLHWPIEPRLAYDILVVDADPRTSTALRTVFGKNARIRVLPQVDLALGTLDHVHYDAIVVDARIAIGPKGLLLRLGVEKVRGKRISIVANPEATLATLVAVDSLGLELSIFASPLDAAAFEEREGQAARQARTDNRAKLKQSGMPSGTTPPRLKTVLLVDPAMEALTFALAMKSVCDVRVVSSWEAAELAIANENFTLVLCDASMQSGETRVYRKLWALRPELKRHMVLLASSATAEAMPPSSGAVARPLATRPLDQTKLFGLIEQFGRKR